MLDTRISIETPEGVELSLSVAGPVPRAQAWLVDIAVKAVIATGLAIVAALLGGLGRAVLFGGLLLLTWFYSVAFEVLHGATPGKRAVGLRVVHDDGTPVGWSAAAIRSLVGFADAFPLFHGVGLVSMLVHPAFKRLGDLAAGTVVVHAAPVPARRGAGGVAPQAPPFPLRPEEQRALVDFADRAPRLTSERRQELAGLAGPTFGAAGASAVERLLGHAAWITGAR